MYKRQLEEMPPIQLFKVRRTGRRGGIRTLTQILPEIKPVIIPTVSIPTVSIPPIPIPPIPIVPAVSIAPTPIIPPVTVLSVKPSTPAITSFVTKQNYLFNGKRVKMSVNGISMPYPYVGEVGIHRAKRQLHVAGVTRTDLENLVIDQRREGVPFRTLVVNHPFFQTRKDAIEPAIHVLETISSQRKVSSPISQSPTILPVSPITSSITPPTPTVLAVPPTPIMLPSVLEKGIHKKQEMQPVVIEDKTELVSKGTPLLLIGLGLGLVVLLMKNKR